MRSALITGASRGIGRGIALELARLGYGLTVTSRQQAQLDPCLQELRDAATGDVEGLAMDLSDRDALPELIRLHESRFGHLNALVLNGGMGLAGAVHEMPLRHVDKMFDVNFGSAFYLIQAALPLLRKGADRDHARGARIVALASITGIYSQAGLAAYGASKAALMSLIENVNLEESGEGVMATAIAPGYVATDMSAWLKDSVAPEEMIGVDDVVAVVKLILALSRSTSLPRVVLTRSGTNGYGA